MSGSHDKTLRATQRALGTERRQRADRKASQKETKRKRTTAIIAAIVALVIIAAFTINSNLFYNTLSAVTVDNRSFTTAEFNYYYFNSYNTMYTNLGDYAESMYNLNTSKPLNSQKCPILENGTWADYFRQDALNQLKLLTLLLNYADDNGITITDDNLEAIQNQIDTVNQNYSLSGYSSSAQYLSARYGKGFNTKVLRLILERSALASQAETAKNDTFTFTQDELDAYYSENKTTLDFYTYRYSYVTAALDPETGAPSDDTLADAKRTAERISVANTDEDFISLTDEYIPKDTLPGEDLPPADDEDTAGDTSPADEPDTAAEPEPNLPTTSQGSSISGEKYFDWLADDSRKIGNTEVFADDNGCGVIIFLGRDDNTYKLRSARHILSPTEQTDGVYTDESKAEAKAKAEEYLAEYNEGGKTEESFAALATQYSTDAGSNKKGGLYDEIYKNQMVPEFNDFVYGENRKSGDVAIVYGETSGYSGYHVVYYVGEDDIRYCDLLAREKLKAAAYSDWQKAEMALLTQTTHLSLHFGR